MLTKGNVKIGLEWRFGPDWPGHRCGAKTRQGTDCQRPAKKKNGRCRLHGGASTGAKTSEGRERISEANMRHGKYTKDKLEKQRENAALGRSIRKEIRQIEQGLVKEGVLARDWRQHFPSKIPRQPPLYFVSYSSGGSGRVIPLILL